MEDGVKNLVAYPDAFVLDQRRKKYSPERVKAFHGVFAQRLDDAIMDHLEMGGRADSWKTV